jgi:hypothetical protein
LLHLAGTLVNDLMSLSDEELLAEVIEDGLAPEAEAARIRARINAALDEGPDNA